MELDLPRTRLLALIREHDTDLATVSKAVKRNHAYLQQYMTRHTPRELPEGVREALGKHFGVEPDHFRRTPSPSASSKRLANNPSLTGEGTNELDVRGGAGPGLLPARIIEEMDRSGRTYGADPIIGRWEFPDGYLSRSIGVRPENARIIEVQGDSMVPTLQSGDRVMVDLHQTNPSQPGLFALWDGIGVVIKRVEHIFNSEPPELRILSDNPQHAPYTGSADEVRIIGRIVWYARKM